MNEDLKDINLDTYRSSQIGIVFQSYNLLPFMTASENIILHKTSPPFIIFYLLFKISNTSLEAI